jgi:hypothetical protein
MKDLIIKLRQQLVSMIEEIDNYNIPLDATIFIKKEDLKWIKYLGKLNSYRHEFEYKNGIKFNLGVSPSYPLEQDCYKKLIDGSLELIILNKKENSDGSSYYVLEDPIKTKLRNLYNPTVGESEGIDKTQNE